jgi:hypothetical protein
MLETFAKRFPEIPTFSHTYPSIQPGLHKIIKGGGVLRPINCPRILLKFDKGGFHRKL